MFLRFLNYLLFVLFFGCGFSCIAQTAGDDYMMGNSHFNAARAKLKEMQEYNADANQKIINEYKTAAQQYLEAIKKNEAFRSICVYQVFNCYLQIAERYFDARADSFSLIYAHKAIEIWPNAEEIEESDIVKGKNIQNGGVEYPVTPLATHKVFIDEFYWARYLAVELYFAKGDSEKCRLYAEETAMGANKWGANKVAFYAANYACITNYLKENACKGAHFACIGIKNAAMLGNDYKPTMPDKTDLSYMEGCLQKDLFANCISKEDLQEASAGLSILNSSWGNFSKDLKLVAEVAYAKKGRSFDFLYNMLRYSYEHKDQTETDKWEQRIKKGKRFTPNNWAQLADLYKANSKAELYKHANKKSRR